MEEARHMEQMLLKSQREEALVVGTAEDGEQDTERVEASSEEESSSDSEEESEEEEEEKQAKDVAGVDSS